jgi:hypothetical protein
MSESQGDSVKLELTLCVGFSDACMTNPSTRAGGRCGRRAKARNRGQDRVFGRCALSGFEAYQGLVANQPEGEADQDRREGSQLRPLCRLPDGRSRYPETTLR